MARTRNKNGHSTNTSCETSPIRQHLSELALEATQNITRELSMFEEMRSMMERIMGELADVKVEIRQMREEQTALRQQLERSNQRQTPPTVIRQRPGSQLQGPEVRQPEGSPGHFSTSQDYELLPPPVQFRSNISPRAERRSVPEGHYTPAPANTGSSVTPVVLNPVLLALRLLGTNGITTAHTNKIKHYSPYELEFPAETDPDDSVPQESDT